MVFITVRSVSTWTAARTSPDARAVPRPARSSGAFWKKCPRRSRRTTARSITSRASTSAPTYSRRHRQSSAHRLRSKLSSSHLSLWCSIWDKIRIGARLAVPMTAICHARRRHLIARSVPLAEKYSSLFIEHRSSDTGLAVEISFCPFNGAYTNSLSFPCQKLKLRLAD